MPPGLCLRHGGAFLLALPQPPQGGKRQTEVPALSSPGRRRWPVHPRGQQAGAGGLAVITAALLQRWWRRLAAAAPAAPLGWGSQPAPVPRGRCVLRSVAAKGESLRPRGAPLRVGCCPGSQVLTREPCLAPRPGLRERSSPCPRPRAPRGSAKARGARVASPGQRAGGLRGRGGQEGRRGAGAPGRRGSAEAGTLRREGGQAGGRAGGGRAYKGPRVAREGGRQPPSAVRPC